MRTILWDLCLLVNVCLVFLVYSNVIGAAADSWLAIMDSYLVLGSDGRKKQMLKAIDVYYDALDAPKKGAKVDLPLDLKLKKFPHYMLRKQSFESTSILGLIYDIVVSQNAEEPPPSGTDLLVTTDTYECTRIRRICFNIFNCVLQFRNQETPMF